MLNTRFAAVLISTLGLCAAAGCRTSNGGAGVKDLEAKGESSSGKSNIDLKFYPIKGRGNTPLIQMERCVTAKSSGATDCEFNCASQADIITALNDKGENGNAVMERITDDKKGKTKDEDLFKALQQVVLDKNISSRCDAADPFHAPEGVTKQSSKERLNSGAENAQSYTLLDDGTFYRTIDGLRCDITRDVVDFKISSHPNDVALAYFIKAGDLWIITRSADPSGNNCPKVHDSMLFPNVAKVGSKYRYFVTSNTNTTIVNMALNENGAFVGWDNKNPLFREPNITNVEMNTCFGAGLHKSFDSYVAFLQNQSGRIIAVKGNGNSSTDFTLPRDGRYDSINDFQAREKVCQ